MTRTRGPRKSGLYYPRRAIHSGGMNSTANLGVATAIVLLLAGCMSVSPHQFQKFVLDYDTPADPDLQDALEHIDTDLRARYGMTAEQSDVGVLDLRNLRVAMVNPDREEYAASIPKIGILLAYFQLHPEAAANLDPTTRHELGLMIKASSNEMAAKYSQEMGLAAIRHALDRYQFYDSNHGGGIWMGKHYSKDGERLGDPVGDNSHAATVRQLLRFYLLLEQDQLVSPEASKTMREIFASPDIPQEDNKFVKGLAGTGVTILRKSGTWEDWQHDSAVVTGPGRHYILVGLTKSPHGDDYLGDLAAEVDAWLTTHDKIKKDDGMAP
jgi:beta-lactamase class A